jgi:hypothetical protein
LSVRRRIPTAIKTDRSVDDRHIEKSYDKVSTVKKLSKK